MKRVLFFGSLLALASAASAELKLASPFTSQMVLQRVTNAPIWGWSNPGQKIKVSGSWGASAETTAKSDGKWSLKLRTGKAGGPFTVTVQGENTVVLDDVLLGEVWLCSGQSNMEWPGRLVLPHVPAGKGAGDPNLPIVRFFNVPNVRSQTPKETCEAKWTPCNAETVANNSAIAYFFARYLVGELKVPIGIIQSDWGGTEVEVWIREGALRELPGFAARIDAVKGTSGNFAAEQAAWQRRLQTMEKGLGTYEKPEFDDSGWKAIAHPDIWDKEDQGEIDGFVWYRARFDLSVADAASTLTLELGDIDDEDITFVNGQKVGENKVWDSKRKYSIPAGVLKAGTNVLAVRVLDTGGGGGFRSHQEIKLSSPTRIIPIANWRKSGALNLADTRPPGPQRWPAADLYNGMIAPIVPYAIRGALWYQGESNVSRAVQYRQTFPLLIKNWRQDWAQGDFPFYFAQIAPFSGYGGSGASAELREAQLLTLKMKNTGMAVTTDITDNLADIHPVNKWDVGRRFALMALNRIYGKKQIDSGPIYRSHKVEGAAIRVQFDSPGDFLMVRGGNLSELTIAGADGKFVPAKAKLEGASMVVWADSVAKPVAVRYGWSDAPKPGLFNSSGLPASPFRTDNFPALTEKAGW